MTTATVRLELPANLSILAGATREVTLDVSEPFTQAALLDALEARFPMLRGTIRDHTTRQRRGFLRFFACEEDLSHLGLDARLPDDVLEGKQAFLVVGAVSGGSR